MMKPLFPFYLIFLITQRSWCYLRQDCVETFCLSSWFIVNLLIMLLIAGALLQRSKCTERTMGVETSFNEGWRILLGFFFMQLCSHSNKACINKSTYLLVEVCFILVNQFVPCYGFAKRNVHLFTCLRCVIVLFMSPSKQPLF